MKASAIAWGALVVCLAVTSVSLSAEPEKKAAQDEKPSVWMKRKLDFSQNILTGLTEHDFDRIQTSAEAMNVLGYFEKWVRADKPNYKRQLRYFEFANQEIIRQAQEKNLEGATLAYTQLIVSCVQCHKIVRDAPK